MHIFGNISVTVYETVYVDKLTELSSWVGFFLCKEYIWWCFIFRNNGELGWRTAERCGQQETWWTGKNSPQNSYCKLRLTSSTWCALCIIWLIVKQNKKFSDLYLYIFRRLDGQLMIYLIDSKKLYIYRIFSFILVSSKDFHFFLSFYRAFLLKENNIV